MLEDAGLDFNVLSSDVNEDILKQEMVGMSFEEQVVRLASAKAQEVSLKNQDHIVIGGDQMCVCNNKIFGPELLTINIAVSAFIKMVSHYGSILKSLK